MRYGLLSRERDGGARRAVGRNRDDIESTLDKVAEVGALSRDADAEPQQNSTLSGPDCFTTSPITSACFGTSFGSNTRIIPMPMLNVPHISSSETCPRLRMSPKMGFGIQVDLRTTAPSPSGSA